MDQRSQSGETHGKTLPIVLHISGDFPDPIVSAKTPVIRSLVELTAHQFDHRVISINRQSPGVLRLVKDAVTQRPVHIEKEPFDFGQAWHYFAPSHGLFHRTRLISLGDRIAEECRREGFSPSLIIGHKLTIEGFAAKRAAQVLGVPFALSIQGNTDAKILAARPDLIRSLSAIYHGASVVFPFTPWALREVERKLGRRQGETALLPCPTDLDQTRTPQVGGNGLISVFHLRNFRGKNLAGLVDAYRQIARDGDPPPLEIIGGGSASELEQCRAITREFPQITFAGAMDRAQLAERMQKATALVLPSLRESFGLVFVEALFAGLPIIYPAATAVDGYFDQLPFALRVNARDPSSIAGAIGQATSDEENLKAALAEWQASDAATRFKRSHIATVFADGLNAAIYD